jgi:uncharacterized protein (UPF0147 family)
MESFFTKIAELKFDRLTTLRIIEKIEDLNAIFTEDVKLPFSVLYRLANDGKLPDSIDEMITSIFEELISTKEEYAVRYNQLLNTGEDFVLEPVVEPVVEPVAETKPKVVKVVKVAKVVNDKSIPRRYGKERIDKDITNQGGVATPIQRAMLSTNNLKNLFVNVSNKLIKDYFADEPTLTDEDYRKIQAVVTTVERQFKEIIKKK